MTVRILAASAILLAGVTVGSAVQAQQTGTPSSGNTSGPATGGNVQPSTAVQKDNPQAHTGAPTTAAGAPGATAKPGTEAGPAAKPASK